MRVKLSGTGHSQQGRGSMCLYGNRWKRTIPISFNQSFLWPTINLWDKCLSHCSVV